MNGGERNSDFQGAHQDSHWKSLWHYSIDMMKNGMKVLGSCQDGPNSNKELLHKGLSPPSPVPVFSAWRIHHVVCTALSRRYPAGSAPAGRSLGCPDHGFCFVKVWATPRVAPVCQDRGSSKHSQKLEFRHRGNLWKHGYPWAVGSTRTRVEEERTEAGVLDFRSSYLFL